MRQKDLARITHMVLLLMLLGIIGCIPQIKEPVPPATSTNPQQITETDTPTTQILTAINQPQTMETNTPTTQVITATIQPQTTETDTPTIQKIPDNWKTYRNTKFGFMFMYPPDLGFVSSGPNEVQKALDRGEMISGTAAPSYDTITFSNSANKKQFDVTVFWIRDDKVSPDKFNEGYLWYGSACDLRWNHPIIEGPTLVEENGISILEIQVLAAMPPEEYRGCYYFKNSAGNVIVFGISGYEQKSNFLNVFQLVGYKILPTLHLLK